MTTIKTWQERIKPEYHSVERFAMAGMQIEIDELRAENAKLRNLRECWRDALGEAVKVCETFGDEYMCQSTTSEIVKEIRELK